jgi:hypothetical protein
VRSCTKTSTLDVDIAAIKRELHCYITLNPRRRRRHGAKFRSYSALLVLQSPCQ